MDYIFRNFYYIRVYLDGVFIFSRNLEEHFKHLVEVLEMIESHNFKLKPIKCSFAQNQVELLEHLVDINGVSVDPKKIQCLK